MICNYVLTGQCSINNGTKVFNKVVGKLILKKPTDSHKDAQAVRLDDPIRVDADLNLGVTISAAHAVIIGGFPFSFSSQEGILIFVEALVKV